MTQFICGGEKYEVGGPDLGVIGLPVKLSGLPGTLEVEGKTLTLRSDFHVTLVHMSKIVQKYGVTVSDFINKVTADFCVFVQDNPIDFVRYRNEYRTMSNGERFSVVVMCDVSNLDKLVELLNTKYGLALENPPTHVTLYTLQPNTGISMIDADDLQTQTKIIQAPVKL